MMKSTILSLLTIASAEEGFCNIRECGCPPYREPWCVLFVFVLVCSECSAGLFLVLSLTVAVYSFLCTLSSSTGVPHETLLCSHRCVKFPKDFVITRVVKCGVVNQNQPPPRPHRQNSTCTTLAMLRTFIATKPIIQILFTSPWDILMASVLSNWSIVSIHTKFAKATATKTQNIARTIC
jgi:hypothetical protein